MVRGIISRGTLQPKPLGVTQRILWSTKVNHIAISKEHELVKLKKHSRGGLMDRGDDCFVVPTGKGVQDLHQGNGGS